jgi:hypothetical protein
MLHLLQYTTTILSTQLCAAAWMCGAAVDVVPANAKLAAGCKPLLHRIRTV